MDVLDECIYFILIWNTSGLIKLNFYLLALLEYGPNVNLVLYSINTS
jgi:hypothetical protein